MTHQNFLPLFIHGRYSAHKAQTLKDVSEHHFVLNVDAVWSLSLGLHVHFREGICMYIVALALFAIVIDATQKFITVVCSVI